MLKFCNTKNIFLGCERPPSESGLTSTTRNIIEVYHKSHSTTRLGTRRVSLG